MDMHLPLQISLPTDWPVYETPLQWVHELAHAPVDKNSPVGTVIARETGLLSAEFGNSPVALAFDQVFRLGRDWSHTEFYQLNADRIMQGEVLWNCDTVERFESRLNLEVRALVDQIAQHGYLSQGDLQKRLALNDLPEGYWVGHQTPHANDEVTVGINEFGQVCFLDGRHRLAIARNLGIPMIPARVAFRHEEWVSFHHRLAEVALGLNSGRHYHQIDHPDLDYLPFAHGSERYALVSKALGRLDELEIGRRGLDVGANMGNLSLYLVSQGWGMTAVENNFAYCETMEKIALAGGMELDVRHLNFFDIDLRGFDVIFAFNIFHHFTNDQEQFAAMVRTLKTCEASAMVFQPHNIYAGDSGFGAYRRMSPDAFAEFVAEMAGFSRIEFLGNNPYDRRSLYLLLK